MSKYIYFQDSHLKGINPSKRLDNYFESWMIKFKEVLKLAKKNKCEKIICGGDLLDTPIVSTSVIDEFLDLLEEYGIPMHIVWGNHDEIGHKKETSKNTSLAHMLRRCKLLTDGDFIDDDYASIKCYDYYHNIEEDLNTKGIMFDDKFDGERWKIAIVHAFITPKPFFKEVLHSVSKNIPSNADLVLVAHNHYVWTKKEGDTEYVDIGAFGRCKSSEGDIKPCVMLLDTKKRTYEVIELKKAKPLEEIFDISKKEHDKEISSDLETFIESLKDFKSQDMDLRGTIELLAKEQNIDRGIVDIIINKLGELENA